MRAHVSHDFVPPSNCRVLLELVTALKNSIPIVGVSLTSGAHTYNFADAAAFLRSLEVRERGPNSVER